MDKVTKKLREIENQALGDHTTLNRDEVFTLIKIARVSKYMDDNIENWFMTDDRHSLADARNDVTQALNELGEL